MRIPWNKGLTKEDPRVLKNISSDGARRNQFKPGCRKVGMENFNWKGGSYIHQGYRYIRMPEHPYAKNGYIQEHRIVMERMLGRILNPKEIIHHINGDTLDNREENLELHSQGEHINIHINNKTE